MATAEIVAGTDAELAEGGSLKFAYRAGDRDRTGFVVRHKGRLFAFINECRHIPMSLDWVENRFFSNDGCYLQCATHGALYDIETGLCIDGPPVGKRLHTLEVAVRNDEIVVKLPAPR